MFQHLPVGVPSLKAKGYYQLHRVTEPFDTPLKVLVCTYFIMHIYIYVYIYSPEKTNEKLESESHHFEKEKDLPKHSKTPFIVGFRPLDVYLINLNHTYNVESLFWGGRTGFPPPKTTRQMRHNTTCGGI